ncbi:hypothetical protein VTK26DRAFT_3476 [Humicola hyalothermophila]
MVGHKMGERKCYLPFDKSFMSQTLNTPCEHSRDRHTACSQPDRVRLGISSHWTRPFGRPDYIELPGPRRIGLGEVSRLALLLDPEKELSPDDHRQTVLNHLRPSAFAPHLH